MCVHVRASGTHSLGTMLLTYCTTSYRFLNTLFLWKSTSKNCSKCVNWSHTAMSGTTVKDTTHHTTIVGGMWDVMHTVLTQSHMDTHTAVVHALTHTLPSTSGKVADSVTEHNPMGSGETTATHGNTKRCDV